jgi:hypothetical protein
VFLEFEVKGVERERRRERVGGGGGGEGEGERGKSHHERDLEEATDEEYSQEEDAYEYPPIHSLLTNQLLKKEDGEQTTHSKDNEEDGEQNPTGEGTREQHVRSGTPRFQESA